MRKFTQNEMQNKKMSVESLKKLSRHSVVLVLDNLRSAHNVGAIFRTADSALVEKIFLVGVTPCPPSAHIDKTALGAADVVPWQHYEKIEDVLEDLKKNGYTLVSLEQTDGSISYASEKVFLKKDFPIALVVGNEVDGVSQYAIDKSDYSVDIPMYGRASSLNVSTATGIVVYEILRRLMV